MDPQDDSTSDESAILEYIAEIYEEIKEIRQLLSHLAPTEAKKRVKPEFQESDIEMAEEAPVQKKARQALTTNGPVQNSWRPPVVQTNQATTWRY